MTKDARLTIGRATPRLHIKTVYPNELAMQDILVDDPVAIVDDPDALATGLTDFSVNADAGVRNDSGFNGVDEINGTTGRTPTAFNSLPPYLTVYMWRRTA